EPRRAARRRARARRRHRRAAGLPVGGRGVRRVAVPADRRARVPRRDGDGGRQAGVPDGRRARPHRARRADARDGARARPVGRADGAARRRRAEDGDPVRAVPRRRLRRRALRRPVAAPPLPRPPVTGLQPAEHSLLRPAAEPEPARRPERVDASTGTADLVADLLEATGLLPGDRLRALRAGAGRSGSIADAIVAGGLASTDAIASMLAARYQLPLVDLRATGVSADAAAAIPLHVLQRATAVPYELEDGRLRVAIADPQNVQGIDELRLATGYHLELAVAPRDTITGELDRLGRVARAIEGTLSDADVVDASASELEAADGVSDAPVVRIVNSIILQAAEDGASDLHFEAQEDALVVRFRIDGVLHEIQRIPRRLAPGVTTRLKVLAQ